MIIQTVSGFKVMTQGEGKNGVIKDSMDHINNVSSFVKDTHENGIFHAIFGEFPAEYFKEKGLELLHFIVDYSDILVIVSMAFGVGALCGSKRAKNYLYWSCISFVILKLLGGYV